MEPDRYGDQVAYRESSLIASILSGCVLARLLIVG